MHTASGSIIIDDTQGTGKVTFRIRYPVFSRSAACVACLLTCGFCRERCRSQGSRGGCSAGLLSTFRCLEGLLDSAGDVFERAVAATAEAEHAGKATWDRELAAAAHQLLVEWQQELLEDD